MKTTMQVYEDVTAEDVAADIIRRHKEEFYPKRDPSTCLACGKTGGIYLACAAEAERIRGTAESGWAMTPRDWTPVERLRCALGGETWHPTHDLDADTHVAIKVGIAEIERLGRERGSAARYRRAVRDYAEMWEQESRKCGVMRSMEMTRASRRYARAAARCRRILARLEGM